MTLSHYPKLKLFISFLIVFITALGIAASLYLITLPQDPRRRAADTGITLAFEPNSLNLKPNDTYQVNLLLDPQAYSISGVTLTLAYDPTLVVVTGLTPTGSFPIILSPASFQSGTASITLGSSCDSVKCLPYSGSVTAIARLNLTALKVGQATLAFTDPTIVTAVNLTQNAVSGLNPLTLTIANLPTPTVAPSLTPKATPIPAKSPTPTLKPTSIPGLFRPPPKITPIPTSSILRYQ